jgi:plasmid replication initiation protein
MGCVFRVDRKNTLDDIFKDLQDEMRSQYSIGTRRHTPERRTYHKIEIRTSNKDYKVQARKDTTRSRTISNSVNIISGTAMREHATDGSR